MVAGCYEENIKLFELLDRLTAAMNNPTHITFNEYSLKAVLIFLFLYAMAIGVYFSSRENRRPGEEHGSARWGNVKSVVKRYMDKDSYKNIILSQNMRLGLNAKKHRRNLNVLVVGGSGAGKTRFYAKPNLMQCNTSFIVADPKGEMLRSIAPLLIENGYDIKVFNLIEPENSDGYNPFVYIRKDEDVIKLISNLIQNTTPKNASQNDPFWEKSEIALDSALMLYLLHEAPPEEQTFEMLMFLIENAATVEDEDESGYQSPVDILFQGLEDEKPEHIAVRQYKIFKQASGKTAKSILISCGARLAPFDIAELREIMSYDEMELDMVGDQRTALFIIISDTDDTFNFVVAMMYSQLFNLLCDRADDVHHGRLPYHVRILADEFANIGQIPKFDKLIATIRSREISASIILQSQSQLKTIYKDAAETILGNCDTMLFLGGKESSTLKEISETLGKETIDLYNTSDTRGQSRSYGMNYQKTGKELMSRDELAVMDGSKCILQLRGVRPFFSDKFDITKHKRYKELSDYDKKNEFDVEAYMRHRMEVKLTRTQEFDLYAFSEESLAEELNTENKEAEHVKDSDT